MRALIVLLMALSALLASPTYADARPHHHHRAHHEAKSVMATPTFSFAAAATSDSRPRECYGIAWCGCWLRIQKGIADTRYNLASWWHNFGQRVSGPTVGAVARLRHHVGVVVGVAENGNPIIKSGNHNHRVATAEYPARRIIEYRM